MVNKDWAAFKLTKLDWLPTIKRCGNFLAFICCNISAALFLVLGS